MSEPRGPFDDAIRILHEAKGEAILVDEELMEVQLEAVIRVLEAAGRVDKKISLEVHNRKPSVTTTKEQYTNACRQIRALLESLPEED